jgi:hypothetical protein
MKKQLENIMNIEFKKTERGFGKFTFADRLDETCSLQESSVTGPPSIWLGVEDPNPQIMVKDAIALGIPTNGINLGWMKYEMPDGVVTSTRMHLTQEHVKALLPILQKFAETGEIYDSQLETSH